MKYFTRQRFRAIQGDSRAAERDWKRASASYAQHIREIRPQLRPSTRVVSTLTFHDGIVRALDRSRNRVRLTVDARNNPWGPRGTFNIDFTDVGSCLARGPVVGDWWLYEEFHLAPAGFALHVLLQRSSLVISASDVTVTELRTTRLRKRSSRSRA
jgi:hypothetical protein